MTDLCVDCSICERREQCINVTLLRCSACGTKGTIQNIFDEYGNFDRLVFSKEVEIIEVEEHSVPICKKCRAMMEPDQGE